MNDTFVLVFCPQRHPFLSYFLIITLLLRIAIRRLVVLVELQTNTVDTMPFIRRRSISLSLEHMSQMSTTIRADNLRSLHTEGAVGVASHSPRDGVEVSGPPASRLKLMVCFVEWCFAAGAGVDALIRHVLVILACERGLGAFLAKNAELFLVQDRSPLIISSCIWVGHLG